MKLFRSKIFRFLMVLVLTFGLFSLKAFVENEAMDVETTKTVYVVSKTLESKHQIEKGDINGIELSLLALPKGYIDDTSKIIGKYVMDPVTEGSFILSHNLADEKHYEENYVPKGYKIVSLALKVDEAAGWKLNTGQIVDMAFSPHMYSTTPEGNQAHVGNRGLLYSERMIEDVEIVDIINEALISIDSKEFTGVPKFAVILVKEDDAEFISMAKDKGRFDVMVIGQ